MAAVSTGCEANCKPRGRILGFSGAAAHPQHTCDRGGALDPLLACPCLPQNVLASVRHGVLPCLMTLAAVLFGLPLSKRRPSCSQVSPCGTPARAVAQASCRALPASVGHPGGPTASSLTHFAEALGRSLGPSLILFIILFCVTTPCYLDSLFVVG